MQSGLFLLLIESFRDYLTLKVFCQSLLILISDPKVLGVPLLYQNSLSGCDVMSSTCWEVFTGFGKKEITPPNMKNNPDDQDVRWIFPLSSVEKCDHLKCL